MDSCIVRGKDLFLGSKSYECRLGDINDLGQIVFEYTLEDGPSGVAIATPVPEPNSALLLFSALSILGRMICCSRLFVR